MPTVTSKYCGLCKGFIGEQRRINRRVCKSEKLTCPNLCGQFVLCYMLDSHMENDCKKEQQIQCDLCFDFISLNDIGRHVEKCKFEFVKCDMCDSKVERCGFSEHRSKYCPKLMSQCYYCGENMLREALDTHLDKCDLNLDTCEKCGVKITRLYMQEHISNSCKKRNVQCNYCEEKNVVADALEEHFDVCNRFPVDCENECKIKVPRAKLLLHLINECSKRRIHCKYCKEEFRAEALNEHNSKCLSFPVPCPKGCAVPVARKDVERHLDEECAKQLNHCTFEKMQCKYVGFPQGLRSHIQQELPVHVDLTRSALENLLRVVEEQKKVIEKLQIKVEKLEVLKNQTERVPCEKLLWKITDFTKKKAISNSPLISPTFYSSRFGYKLKVHLYLNGSGGYNNYLSVLICLCSGEYDAILEWPFKQRVTIKLIDQSRRVRHFSRNFEGWDCASFHKPKKDSVNEEIGYPDFMLYSDVLKGKFVVDDTMFLEVSVE